MIDILTNGFLTNPIPLNINLNYCSHDCAYCFANLNNPSRKADVNGILSQLKNYKHRKDLVSFYMKNVYPINVSNNIDPFSKSNYRIFQQVGNFLLDEDIPMQIATRGGVGWNDFHEAMKPSVWYVSVPYSDDEIRKRLEPNAPSLHERFEMVSELKKKHQVIIALNPLNKNFCESPMEIVEKYAAIGVRNFWVNYMHISNKQKANLTKAKRDAIGDDTLKELALEPTDWYSDKALEIYEYCVEKEYALHGLSFGWGSGVEDIWKQVYGKNILPTEQDFFNWCDENKNDGDYIYFQDFYDFFAPQIPDIETNISKFIFNKVVLSDKSSYEKSNLTTLLHYYWEVKGVSLNWAGNLPVFSWVKQKSATKTDFIYDGEHNKVLMYHPENLSTKDYVIV